MKKVLYTAALLTLALLQLNAFAKGGLTGSDIANSQELQVTQGFGGNALFGGKGGVGQGVKQTAINDASASSSLNFQAGFGGLGGGAVGSGIAGLGSMFGGNKAATNEPIAAE